MVDDSKRIVSSLSLILPTTYEEFIHSPDNIPVITYIESNNILRTNAKQQANVRYSDLGYDVKLWAKTKADIELYSSQIETKMAELGYTLSGGREILYGDLICKLMVFSGLGYES